MKGFSYFFCSILMATLAAAPAIHASDPRAATLMIRLTGFENADGIAKVAIVNSRENYESDQPFAGLNLKIVNGQARAAVTLPFGEYAVKAFHDENGNDELDTRMFGIPTERYGFSNNARGAFGPPPFKKAAFVLGSPKKTITITLK